MATQGLTSGFAYTNIGERNNQSKPQESCKTEHYFQKESSRKSVFQQLQSLWAFFYMQVSQPIHNKQVDHVYQERRTGLSVLMKRLPNYRLRISSKNSAAVLNNLSDSLKVSRLKLSGFLYSLWANKRLRWGLLLLLVIAPLSKFIYLLFPEEGFGDYIVNTGLITINNFETPTDRSGWYYQTIFYWMLMCGELWAPLIAIYGIFLLFPRNYYPSYLVGIPFGYFLSLLIHRMFVSSYDEYHSGVAMSYAAILIILGVIIFFLSDKVLFNQNHRRRATEARIIGLINVPGMTWEEKEVLLKKEAKDWMKQDNELFEKAG